MSNVSVMPHGRHAVHALPSEFLADKSGEPDHPEWAKREVFSTVGDTVTCPKCRIVMTLGARFGETCCPGCNRYIA